MEYQHGGDIYGEKQIALDFSVNTNPLGMPPSVRQAVLASSGSWEQYPDSLCRRLRTELAASCALPPELLRCGNGASELLYSLAVALRPRRALLLAPCFSEYQQALEAVGCEVDLLLLREEENFSLQAAGDRLWERLLSTEAPELLILANPNNPNGAAVPADWLERLAALCEERGLLLVVDECFQWFVEESKAGSLLPYFREHPEGRSKLIILNAFTKIFAMAGLRLGYAWVGDPQILEALDRCRQPWSVSAPAEAAGLAALTEQDFAKKTVKLVAGERAFLSEGLKGLGFRVYPSEANYLLFRASQPIDYLEECRKRGLLIRSCANYQGLDARYYRVAVRTRKENEQLLACLKAIGQGEKEE